MRVREGVLDRVGPNLPDVRLASERLQVQLDAVCRACSRQSDREAARRNERSRRQDGNGRLRSPAQLGLSERPEPGTEAHLRHRRGGVGQYGRAPRRSAGACSAGVVEKRLDGEGIAQQLETKNWKLESK